MDILQETNDIHAKTFLNQVFSTTEEGKGELLNVVQYALMGVIPIVFLNKSIQRFIPDVDGDKSSLELLVEISIQLILMFCGIIIIHRMIVYFPTYSGFKYDNLNLTNVILAFLIIVLSIQTKLGIKVNIIFDRLGELWNGTTDEINLNTKKVRIKQNVQTHMPSQADYLDNSMIQTDMYPPAPVSNNKTSNNSSYDMMMRGGGGTNQSNNMIGGGLGDYGVMAANSVIGGSFGSMF